MTEIHGFTLIEERDVPEINTKARLFKHNRTGAELLSLENDDENKSFTVGFQTPPPDDTGLPHILEHSVLCGSRKYPVKDPFVQLLKTSVKTFLNAMTFSDMTIYPVASTNLKDFYNLVDVYMDAVFYPLITPETLMQEGWHYEADGDEKNLIFKGVVFNEMKAAYSMPERVMGDLTSKTMLADTPYANSSGGDPAAIPNLTYEQFKEFHETFYHPSNARIIFYGDDNPTERLRLVDEFIAEFDEKVIDSTLPLQPQFSEPKSVSAGYDAGEEDKDSKKTMMTVNWLLPEIIDRDLVMELSILSHALVSTPASPLRKALIDSGLGEDITGGGLSTFSRQLSFSIGLKNIMLDDSEQAEALILETLGNLAEDGIDPATIEASINTIEFNMRERNTGGFPRGLMSSIYALPTWMHGGNPIDAISFEEGLANVKERYAEDEEYFQRMIGEYFLNNPHRVTTTLYPDTSVGPKRDATEAELLKVVENTLDDDGLAEIIETANTLRDLQNTPDDPEELAKIPSLTLDDLDRNIKITPQDIMQKHGATVYFHEQPTAGIIYTDVALNLRQLPQEFIPYISLFGSALTKLGTTEQDFVAFTQRMGSKTGGIGVTTEISTRRDDRSDYIAYLVIRAKTTPDKADDMLAIISDILQKVNWDNRERFKQIVLERKARLERGMAMSGHVIAGSRAKAHYAIADWVEEEIGGANHLFFIRELAERVENDWESVVSDLQKIADILLNRNMMLVNVTTEADTWASYEAQIDSFIADQPATDTAIADWQPAALPDHEGLTMPLQVNFNAKAINLYDLGYELHGSSKVITRLLNLDYMWHKIRVQGGAYGGRLGLSSSTGTATFLSWRDPNIEGTMDNFNNAGEFLQNIEMTQEDIEKSIIAAIGDLDSYQLPDAKGYGAMLRHLLGYTDDIRQQYRDEVFATTLEDFKAFGKWLAHVDEGHAAVVGSPDAIKSANESITPKFELTKLL